MDDENVAQNTPIPNETISGRKLEENDAEMITLMKPDSITEQKNSEEEKPNEENHLENIPKPETPSQKEKDEKSAEITSEPEVLSGVSEKTEQKSIVNNSANLETPQQKTEEEQPSEEPANDHNKSIMEKEIEEKQVEHPLMSEAPSDEKTEHISTVQNIPNPDFPQHDKTEQKPVEENNSDKPEKGIKENVPEGYNEKIRDDTEEENTQIIGSLDVNKAKGGEKEEEEPAKTLENREAADGKPNAQQQQPETITGEKENTAMLLDQLLMKEMEEKWIGG
ncbi:unnamed protein product [Cuscuta epithymum]|uniref:Uncharacterized protein n=1 Tax=Cuscuta epithymum TaxID=186058 RepID=A0AAV0CBK2_9ASTE|nr:unnamed protein product [Cuscuta epithymum]